MNCLLDTHAFLWAAFAPEKLSTSVRETITTSENEVAVSGLSFWEIALKYGLGKIELTGCTPEELPEIASEMDIAVVTPTAIEMASFYRLPREAHKDPFDRMIIWQAIQQSRVLLSKDSEFAAYKAMGLKLFW